MSNLKSVEEIAKDLTPSPTFKNELPNPTPVLDVVPAPPPLELRDDEVKKATEIAIARRNLAMILKGQITPGEMVAGGIGAVLMIIVKLITGW
jgi:hypothetical protein